MPQYLPGVFENLPCPAVFKWGRYNFSFPPAQSPGFSTRSKPGSFDLTLEKILVFIQTLIRISESKTLDMQSFQVIIRRIEHS